MPSEMGWGTHEKQMPKTALQHTFGSKAAIYFKEPGINIQIKSWCPTEGPQLAYMITHEEPITISDYFTVKNENGEAIFRPTCNYAYHPCE